MGYEYYCLNPIAQIGLNGLGQNFTKTEEIKDADAILVRSAGMHEMEFDIKLKVIGRAGAGVNNIPLDKCAEKGIVVFNTPGANANGVKELVLAGLFLASRDIVGGIDWVKANQDDENIAKSAEKAKKAFAGCEIIGKKLGVIGLGAIGALVANAALQLGMEVYGYDPYISVEAAWKLSKDVYHAKNVEEIYRECDYITIHVPAMDSTKGMIDEAAIAMMKDKVVLLNFSRDVLVKSEAVIPALENGKVKRYVTDFATSEIVKAPNTIVIPHLGASTAEAEDNCAVMAAKEIRDYLENGNIHNSVNYPNCEMGAREKVRITILHKNMVNMIGQFTAILTKEHVNIANMLNKSRGEYAYTMIDVDSDVTAEIEQELGAVEGVCRVRIIK